jgi:competence protein ComEC
MKLLKDFLEERERWFLWLPVFMGLGIVLYFSWLAEPPFWAGALAIALCAVPVFLLRQSVWQPLALILLSIAIGHEAGQVETAFMAQPMVRETLEKRDIVGRVMVVEYLPEGYRLYLEDAQVEGLLKVETPRNLRIKVRYQDETPEPGSWVSLRASLFPLSGPLEPGGFDFRRYAFFQGYAATGYALSKWHEAEGPPPSIPQRMALFFENIRIFIQEKILETMQGRERAVAVALITGDQSSIDKNTLTAMRISGISHVLSVSGLHIALVAGIVFFTLRALMALIPWIALHWPIKKIAAAAALIAALFYTFMCAAPVPAVRSMLMSGMVLIAIMVDKRALSMRLVAFAALVCLLFAPSALLDPSFQLSFGAVIALIAAFEKNEFQLARFFMSEGIIGKIRLYLMGSIITSLVASFATAPIVLYHFQQVNWYGLATNLIAVPLSSFIIMPAAVVAVLAMPFGLQAWPLEVMNFGIHWMIESAAFFANLPGAATYHPAMPGYALPLIAFGGLWVCLWKRRWRFLGLISFMLGALSFLITPRPDVFVADDGITTAVRMEDGRLAVRAKNLEEFTIKSWVQRDGFARDDREHLLNWFELAENGGQRRLSCQGMECIYRKNNKAVAFPVSETGARDFCGQADVVVMPYAASLCPNKPVINGARTRAEGMHTLRIRKNGSIALQSAKEADEKRPWD